MDKPEKLATCGTPDEDNQNTKHTTIRQQTPIRHEPCYNQLEVQMNRTAYQESCLQQDWDNDIMYCMFYSLSAFPEGYITLFPFF